MPTERNPKRFEFARVEGRQVVADFDGGSVTSDAGALLLGATDRAIGLVGRLAGCFRDARRPELIEHEVATLVGQRVFGIALGYEDLNDHDDPRHDPVMAILAKAGNADPLLFQHSAGHPPVKPRRRFGDMAVRRGHAPQPPRSRTTQGEARTGR